MTRRLALAVSSALTILVTFGVVSIGAQTGLFGSDHKAAPKQAAAAGAPSPAPVTASAVPPSNQPVPTLDPLVVTDYVYVDQTPVPIYVLATRTAQRSESASSAPAAIPTSAAARNDASGPTATRTAPPIATPPPAASATSHASPSATPVPPTQAPTQAPATAIPTQPQGQPAEIEFVGAVTAINGNVVTFSHGGASTPVTVTSGLSRLAVGVVVQVHARLQGGVYVATELETGD